MQSWQRRNRTSRDYSGCTRAPRHSLQRLMDSLHSWCGETMSEQVLRHYARANTSSKDVTSTTAAQRRTARLVVSVGPVATTLRMFVHVLLCSIPDLSSLQSRDDEAKRAKRAKHEAATLRTTGEPGCSRPMMHRSQVPLYGIWVLSLHAQGVRFMIRLSATALLLNNACVT